MNSDLLHSGLLGLLPSEVKRPETMQVCGKVGAAGRQPLQVHDAVLQLRKEIQQLLRAGISHDSLEILEFSKFAKEQFETDSPGLWLYTCGHDHEPARHKDEARAKVSLWARRLHGTLVEVYL